MTVRAIPRAMTKATRYTILLLLSATALSALHCTRHLKGRGGILRAPVAPSKYGPSFGTSFGLGLGSSFGSRSQGSFGSGHHNAFGGIPFGSGFGRSAGPVGFAPLPPTGGFIPTGPTKVLLVKVKHVTTSHHNPGSAVGSGTRSGLGGRYSGGVAGFGGSSFADGVFGGDSGPQGGFDHLRGGMGWWSFS